MNVRNCWETRYGFSIKTRRRTSAYQLKILEKEFEVNSKPDPKRREELSVELEMNPREIQVWVSRMELRIWRRFWLIFPVS
jgi:hypothetical protein